MSERQHEMALMHLTPAKPVGTWAPRRSGGAGLWRRAKVRLGLLLFALGVPIPIVLLVVLLRGCS